MFPFNFPTPFGSRLVTPDIFGGGHFSLGQGYITPPNAFGEQQIFYSDFGCGAEGTIRKDIFGEIQISYHKVWETPPSCPIIPDNI